MLTLACGLFHTQFQVLPDFLMLYKSQFESQDKNPFMVYNWILCQLCFHGFSNFFLSYEEKCYALSICLFVF